MYKYIQGCRGLAALLVVLFHLGETLAKPKYLGSDADPLKKLFSFGSCGVEFFFVLSGFIITLVHRKDFGVPQRLFHYVRKRLVRIYPTYIIIFVGVYLLAIAFPSLRQTVPHDAGTLVKSILLLPHKSANPNELGTPVLAVAWTLQYEMLFYAAIAFAILNRYLLPALIAVFLINREIAAYYGITSFPESFFANDCIFLFMLGMLAAFVAKSKLEIQRPQLLSIIAGLAFLCLAAMDDLFGRESHFSNIQLGYGIVSAVLIVGLVRLEDRGKTVVENRFLELMGDSSYALYLIHFPLISVFCKVLTKFGAHGISGQIIGLITIVPACVLLAIAFHLYVERPILTASSSSPRRVQPAILNPVS